MRKPLPWREGSAVAADGFAARIPVYDVDDIVADHEADASNPEAASRGWLSSARRLLFSKRRRGVIDLIQEGEVSIKAGCVRRFTAEGVVIDEGASRHRAQSDREAAGEATGTVTEAAEKAEGGAVTQKRTGAVTQYDAVIYATGFKHELLEFLCESDGLLTPAAPPPPAAGTSDSAAASAAGSGARSATPPAVATPASPRGGGVASSRGLAPLSPIIDSSSRSLVIDSIYLVGLDQFVNSTLSVGPVLGYRGYDVGAAIASELYGPPPKPLRFPSLPADEQTAGSKPLLTPARALGTLGAGIVIGGLAGGLITALRARRAPAAAQTAAKRTLHSMRPKGGAGK